MTKKYIEIFVECPECGHEHEVHIEKAMLGANPEKRDRWLSAKEAAKWLGVSRRTLDRYLSTGKLKATRLKGKVVDGIPKGHLRIRESDLEACRSSLEGEDS